MTSRRIAPILFFPLLLLFCATAAYSQQGEKAPEPVKKYRNIPIGPFVLDFSGNIRLRYEYQSGFDVRRYTPETSDQFLLERIMFDLNLRLDTSRRFFLQFRDAHALGSHLGRESFSNSNPMEDLWDIRQAYFEWRQMGFQNLSLKLGRQQISYGDQRIFGPGLWGNTGRYAWDAALVRLDTKPLWLEAWAGRPIKNRPEVWPNRAFKAPTAFVLYSGIKGLPCRLDVFYTAKYDRRWQTQGELGKGDILSHSMGFQLQKAPGKGLDYGAAFIGQAGRYGSDKIHAFGANSSVGVTIPWKWRPRLAGQFTWGSGDRDPGDGIHGTFDGVFGGADINFYGDLNLFFWANLRDYEWDLHFSPISGWKVFVEHHYFTLDRARDAWYTTGLAVLRRDPQGRSGKDLGHEINLRLSLQLGKNLQLFTGWGRFLPGAFVKATGAANSASGYFLQASYEF